MVVDQGFDVRHPAFAGKIAGCYDIRCPSGASFEVRPGESDDDTAARYADHLRTPGPECTVSEGVTLEVDEYLERFHPEDLAYWNDQLLGKKRFDRPDITPELFESMLDMTGSADYHGTATAGAVTYENDIDVVLVQIQLSSPDDLMSLPCFQQQDIDLETRLLSRSDVADAYIQAPLDGRDRHLLALRRQHDIRVENWSFGVPSTAVFEALLRRSGCPSVKLGEWMLANAALDGRRETFLRENGALSGSETLIFQAAGNYGSVIDDGGESLSCTPDRVDRALVGAYELYRGRPIQSAFSNYGECVDVYALGQQVILPSASGFYGLFNGTSFAAPLAARYASSLAQQAPTTVALRDLVFSARDANRFLPVSTMPVELGAFTVDTAPSRPTPPITALFDSHARRTLLRFARD
jgi:subtilisin family serine protease